MAATNKNYIIPLRKSYQRSAPLKRTPKALRAIKDYLKQHTKADEVKIGTKLNELVWQRGITNPPHKVSVNVTVENGVAKAELEGFSYQEAKKIEKKTEPKTMKEKLAEKIGTPIKQEAAEPSAKETGQPATKQEEQPEKKPAKQ